MRGSRLGNMVEPPDLVTRLEEFVASAGPEPFVEFEGRWWTAGEVAAVGRGVVRLLDEAGVPDNVAIGVVVRNHVESVAVLIGLVAACRPVTMIYSHQSAG